MLLGSLYNFVNKDILKRQKQKYVIVILKTINSYFEASFYSSRLGPCAEDSDITAAVQQLS